MSKSKAGQYLRNIRLTLLFSVMVLFINICAITLFFVGIGFLKKFGLLDNSEFERFPLFVFSLSSLIIGTILSLIFGRRNLKPLSELMDAADRIAEGDYSVRVTPKGFDEFRQLGEKFNHMAEEIGSVEMLKNDFINDFSHEFKTPIVSIRGFAKALKWNDLTNEERNEYLDIIINESERLSTLSSNVLTLTKIEKQTILTDKKKFNLSEQIRLSIALLDSKWFDKHIDFIFDCDEFYIVGNEEMLKQVWINLIDNAIKFSPEYGTVKITIHQADGNTSVTVSDDGDGMSEEIKSHIFDKFYQGDTSHTTSGNGLGLSIAKRIVELHNGNIFIRKSDKNGTVFEVEI